MWVRILHLAPFKKETMKNWKTTLCGVLTIAVQAMHYFPQTQPFVEPVTAILIALGLYSAADKSNKD